MRIALLALAVSLALFAVSCDDQQFEQDGVLTLTAADTDQTKTVAVGEAVQIELAGNATTGYRWEVHAIDGAALRHDETLYEPQQTDRVGSGGLFVVKLTAVEAGAATVDLAYRRPWETDAEPAETFTATFNVTAK